MGGKALANGAASGAGSGGGTTGGFGGGGGGANLCGGGGGGFNGGGGGSAGAGGGGGSFSASLSSFSQNGFQAGNGQVIITVSGVVPWDAYQVSEASNVPLGASYVNITNAGTRHGVDPNGGLCANVYVFDPSEELVACCSCYVSPDGLRSLTTPDMIANSLTPNKPNGVVIKLLASMPAGASGATCDPASPTLSTPEPGLRAWSTDLHQNTASGLYQLTEKAFQTAVLSPSELQKLTTFCGFIKANGSNFGVCKDCRVGGSLGGQSSRTYTEWLEGFREAPADPLHRGHPESGCRTSR